MHGNAISYYVRYGGTEVAAPVLAIPDSWSVRLPGKSCMILTFEPCDYQIDTHLVVHIKFEATVHVDKDSHWMRC